jgi:hypothetical protein
VPRAGSRLLTATFEPGDVVVFSQWVLHGAFDGNNATGRCRLSLDVRYHAADGGHDARYQGDDPLGTGGALLRARRLSEPFPAVPI